jgi:catechol 2,3-dioxygenase-like lactoylglutathione lyase family enzyme
MGAETGVIPACRVNPARPAAWSIYSRTRRVAAGGMEDPTKIGSMRIDGFESLILFVADLASARAFYVDALGLPVLFEDEIVVVVGGPAGRVVLHRNDRGHNERGIFPSGPTVGGAAVRFAVEDPDACEREASERGMTVVWPAQDAPWGRFLVLADPDGRSVVLARMRAAPA